MVSIHRLPWTGVSRAWYLFGVASRSIAVGAALPTEAMALAKLVHHVVKVSVHNMGSMVEVVMERHDYCQRSIEKEKVRCSCPWYDNLLLLWKTHLLVFFGRIGSDYCEHDEPGKDQKKLKIGILDCWDTRHDLDR